MEYGFKAKESTSSKSEILYEKRKREGAKWEPQCLSSIEPKGFGTTSNGYLIPCCLCDNKTFGPQKKESLAPLYDEELKLEKNESIDDILLSDQWQNFWKSLKSGPKNAPNVCIYYCYRKNVKTKWDK